MAERLPDESSASGVRCLGCGTPLRYEMKRDYGGDPMWSAGGAMTKARRVRMFEQPGYMGNGHFCTLRCGFRWAVRRVEGR